MNGMNWSPNVIIGVEEEGGGWGGVGVGERVEVNDVFPVGFFCMLIMCVL